MQLKILSWNIWYDGHFGEISHFLSAFDADVIGIQEIVLDDAIRDAIGFLKKLGYYYVFAPTRVIKKDGRTMGNAIFSKYPIVSTETHILSDINSRNALRADIKVGETILHVFSTHLLHVHQQPSDLQELQMENLIKILPSENTIVMGDFNATPESASIRKMKKVMTDNDPSETPTVNPNFFDCSVCDPMLMVKTRLDYIFTSADIKTHLFKVYNAAGSDHLPISLTIQLYK